MGLPKEWDGEWEYDANFLKYQADGKYAKEEKPGYKQYEGKRELRIIKSILHIDVPPLQQDLVELLKHIWTAGVAHTAARQEKFLGRHRQGGAVPEIFDDADPYTAIANPAQSPPGKRDAVAHLDGIARDWTHQLDIERVVGYCFRGENRPIAVPYGPLKQGGFHPPCTRQDDAYLKDTVSPEFKAYLTRRFHWDDAFRIPFDKFKDALNQSMDPAKRALFMEYSTWRAILNAEEMHLGRMIANQLLKGYISTSRSATVAKGFAGTDGWVYCLLVKGGYLVPTKGMDQWTKVFGEQEVAFPGSIPWSDVFGFRQVDDKGFFQGPVYLRFDFGVFDQEAAETVYKLLSGKDQEK